MATRKPIDSYPRLTGGPSQGVQDCRRHAPGRVIRPAATTAEDRRDQAGKEQRGRWRLRERVRLQLRGGRGRRRVSGPLPRSRAGGRLVRSGRQPTWGGGLVMAADTPEGGRELVGTPQRARCMSYSAVWGGSS